MRRATKAGAIIEAILILAGIALLAKALMVGATTYKLVGGAESADGVISAVEDKGFTLVMQFTAAGGPSMVFQQTGLFFNHHEAGQHLTVLYDINNPQVASVDHTGALWFPSIAAGVPGFILLLLGFRLRSERNV